MSYYKVIGFDTEPFSTSPDPDFFYLSRKHHTALTNILIEIHLKRGLSVILGDVGTGKTSLSRKLIQELKKNEQFLIHIVMDPSFETEQQFVRLLAQHFNIPEAEDRTIDTLELKDLMERFLFQKSVVEGKMIVLVIDEAQKLNEMSLEVLRGLLNYETNEFKLLQLVLLGQMELYPKISEMPNFYDRISFKYSLFPLDLDETREMIDFRVRRAGYKSRIKLFFDEAVKEIHEATQGCPRRITMLCHSALKNLVLKNKFVVDAEMIQNIIQDEIRSGWQRENRLYRKISY